MQHYGGGWYFVSVMFWFLFLYAVIIITLGTRDSRFRRRFDDGQCRARREERRDLFAQDVADRVVDALDDRETGKSL